METWMVIQGIGLAGGLVSAIGAGFAFKNGKKGVGVLALLVGGTLGLLGLNATAWTTDPVEEQLQQAEGEEGVPGGDDFDAPL